MKLSPSEGLEAFILTSDGDMWIATTTQDSRLPQPDRLVQI